MSEVCGLIIIDKPSGVSSFSMVSLVRRLTGVRRVGHAGTLDPMASGVLPVAVGRATRLIEYMDDEAKVYEASVRFGVTTETYDAEGAVVEERNASGLTREAVDTALRKFVGDIEQRPPAYSALKVAGKPMYRYAREGVAVDAAARRVRIDSIELRTLEDGVAEIEVVCGKGTYIRSLAHDAGLLLGVGAHLSALRRTRSGGFGIDDAREPEELRRLAEEGRLEEAVLAPDRAMERRPAAIVGPEKARDVCAGRDISFAEEAAGLCRAYSVEGEFLAALTAVGGGRWHPAKVVGCL